MGHYQHPLLNKETGVYSYDQLIVLRKTRMPAVLLEAGSIINRDEELKMDSAERRDIISGGVAAADEEILRCPVGASPDVAATTPSQDHPAQARSPNKLRSPTRRRDKPDVDPCRPCPDHDDAAVAGALGGFRVAEGLCLFARYGSDHRSGHPLCRVA